MLINEIKRTLKIAVPLILTNAGNNLMGIVDTLIVGRVSTAALSGVGAGSTVAGASMGIGAGLLLGMDTMISQAVGAKRYDDADRYLVQGLWLAIFFSMLFMTGIWLIGNFYSLTHASPEIVTHASPYIKMIAWGMPGFFFYFAIQRYWQCFEITTPFLVIIILGNVVNYFAATGLVLGKWGFPALGSVGAGLATNVSRYLMLVMLLVYSFYKIRKNKNQDQFLFKVERTPRWKQLKTLLYLGIPSSGYIAFEVGAFLIATTLATQLGAVQMAAHHITLSIASFTFMFPLGVSIAASIRVGNSIGAGKPDAAKRAAWVAIVLSFLIMSTSALVMLLFPRAIFDQFRVTNEVFEVGKNVLFYAALFQIFDGAQVTIIGSLRGTGDTRTPLICNAIGYYFIGLPVGIALCFWYGWKLPGLWFGLTLGLLVVAVMLLIAFVRAFSGKRLKRFSPETSAT